MPPTCIPHTEIARNRARIDAMERQLEEMNVALAHAESSSISDKQSTDATVAKGVAEAVEAAHVPAGGPVGFETHESEQQKPQQQPGGPNAV